MGERCISNESLGTTGFSYTLSLISGKYKMTILYTLMEFGVVRFNEMKKYIGGISYKTLSTTLKELEAEGEQEYMRLLAEAYDTQDKKDFYEFSLALDALKASLNGDEKTVILDANSELAKILMGGK